MVLVVRALTMLPAIHAFISERYGLLPPQLKLVLFYRLQWDRRLSWPRQLNSYLADIAAAC